METTQLSAFFKGFKRISKGWKDCKDDASPGRPLTSSVDKIMEHVSILVLSDYRCTVRMIAAELNLGKSSAHTILTTHLV